jgi:hypothetical protein
VLIIGSSALLWSSRGGPPEPPGVPEHPAPSASASPSNAAPAGLHLGPAALGYKPTWLPPGFHERFRGVTYSGGAELRVERAWTANPVGLGGGRPANAVIVATQQTATAPDPAATAAHTVDINGKAAVYTEPTGHGGASVGWRADAQHVVEVRTDAALSRADLLRVARSLQVDNSWYVPPMVLGWVPAGRPDVTSELSGNSSVQWNATVVLSDPARPDARITTTYAPSPPSFPPAEEYPVVGGRPAELRTAPGPDGTPTLSLGQQSDDHSYYRLTASCPVSPSARSDLIHLVEQADPVGNLATDWLD